MSHITNAIVSIIIMAIVVHGLLAMVEPYAPYLLIAAVLAVVGGIGYRRSRRW